MTHLQTMVKLSKQGNASAPPSTNPLAQAFFSGKIRDRTTKQSRKAADDLAILKSKHKNPDWQPTNAKVRAYTHTHTLYIRTYIQTNMP